MTEAAKPPLDWKTINPEVAFVASTRAMKRHEFISIGSIFIAVVVATLLHQFPLYLGVFVGFICLGGFLQLLAMVAISDKRIAELHRYLSWIFATTPAEKKSASLLPFPVEIAYRPVGNLFIAKVFGPNGQLEHEIVVTTPDEAVEATKSLDGAIACKVHYDPETKEPVVIDLGSYRCWRAPGFACPPDLHRTPDWVKKLPTTGSGRTHPSTAIVIWAVLFAFGLKYFLTPGQFAMIDGGRGLGPEKWGFIDTYGSVVIKPKFDQVNGMGEPSNTFGLSVFTLKPQKSFHEGLAGVCLDKKWGFTDKSGQLVIMPQFDAVGDFSEGLACVVSGDKCGFVNNTGKVVIPIQFNRHAFDLGWMNFKDGLCPVEVAPSSMGFIDRQGHAIVKAQYSDVWPFSDGLATVFGSDYRKTEFIDPTGKTVLEIPSRQQGLVDVRAVGSFSEGLVRISGRMDDSTGHVGYQFADKTGKPIGKELYDDAKDFSEGFAAVKPSGAGKYGYIDRKGQMVIQPAFDQAGEFHEGFAPVAVYHETKERTDRKWGYINKSGGWLVEPKYTSADSFSEGRAAVGVSKDDFTKTGYIDKSGNLVIPARYSLGFPFSEGLAAVEMTVTPETGK